MKLSNSIVVVLLALTLASQGQAWDDEQEKTPDTKRKLIVAGLVTAGVVAAAYGGFKVWKHFDLSRLFKKRGIEGEEYIGIDLGTSKSGGGLGDELVPDAEGNTMTASAVLFDRDGKAIKTGNAALDEDGVVTSAKRVIGTPFSIAKEDDVLTVVADTRPDYKHMAAIDIGAEESVSPEKVAEEVLRDVKQRIDKHHGKNFNNAVITVPAYFYEFQKAATKRAAHAAGFKHVVLINEPTAAAFAHGAAELDTKKLKQGVNYLIYDFGGGTMDVSIVNAKLEKKQRVFTVNSIEGNPRLGGDDIDKSIAKKFAKDLGLDPDNMKDKVERSLRQQAEKAKIHLSKQDTVYQSKFTLPDQTTPVEVKLSREDFNKEIGKIVQETVDLTHAAIKHSPLEIDEIDEVVLVGGSSRNLLVREKLIEIFGETRLEKSLQEDIDPDEMVAKGAAKYAQVLTEQSNDYHLSDVVPMSLRVDMQSNETGEEVSEVVISKLSATPAEGTRLGSALGSRVRIVIRQGESTTPDENMRLGFFYLDDTEKGNEIDILFKIDTNGTLEVTAKDADTGVEKSKSIDMTATPEKDAGNVKKKSDVNKGGDDAEEILQQLFNSNQTKQIQILQELSENQKITNEKLEILQELSEKLDETVQELSEKQEIKNDEIEIISAQLRELQDELRATGK